MPPTPSTPSTGFSDALFTDLYELTMVAGYLTAGIADATATFDLYFRSPPRGVDLVVASGLDAALTYLERLAFTTADLDYLDGLGRFDDATLEHLAALRFTGTVRAVAEGTPVFSEAPILTVTSRLDEAQLVETALLNRICYSSLVTSNAVQLAAAAGPGASLLEFGARRAHGPDGALTGSRAAMIGGCTATSNVLAAATYDLAASGTQAHAWITAFDDELTAFRAYADTFPDGCVLLVDTYDTLRSGVPNAITVAHELRAQGRALAGVRLDSGDLAALSRATRRMLDDAGLDEVTIVASGDLDAERIGALRAEGAPIDGYGVGTSLLTARADPTFTGVYKLAEVAGRPVGKVSSDPAKVTSPGIKQVWRGDGVDTIGLTDDEPAGRPLLDEVMVDGRRTAPAPSVADIAAACRTHVAAIRRHGADTWRTERTERLDALRHDLLARHGHA